VIHPQRGKIVVKNGQGGENPGGKERGKRMTWWPNYSWPRTQDHGHRFARNEACGKRHVGACAHRPKLAISINKMKEERDIAVEPERNGGGKKWGGKKC